MSEMKYAVVRNLHLRNVVVRIGSKAWQERETDGTEFETREEAITYLKGETAYRKNNKHFFQG